MLIPLSQAEGKSRIYCMECVEEAHNIKLNTVCQMKNLQTKTQQFESEKQKQIAQVYDPFVEKIQFMIATLQNLKEKSVTTFDELIKLANEAMVNLKNAQSKEIDGYSNLTKNLTIATLQQLAEKISGNIESKPNVPEIQQKLLEFQAKFANNVDSLAFYQKDKVNEVNEKLFGKAVLKSKKDQNSTCSALAYNEKAKIIAGCISNDIFIWKQEQFQLVQQSILTGHCDDVLAIVIYESGEIIASGGGMQDKKIKLWKQSNLKWSCIQTLDNHSDRITDLKLTYSSYLISASGDKSIKIWKKQIDSDRLECIQTILEHSSSIYWISTNSDFLASSSIENYFCIFKYSRPLSFRQQQSIFSIHKKIETSGIIRRIYFTESNQLLCQQDNPAKLLIYQQNQQENFQIIQEINFHQQDNTYIMFPIFSIGPDIYVKNNDFIYIIRRSRTGTYFIQFVLSGKFVAGCRGEKQKTLILGNCSNDQVECYDFI